MRIRSQVLTILHGSVLLLLVSGLSPRLRAADPCDLSVLPQGVRAKLVKDYADWQPERLEQLYEDDRAMWAKAHPNDCPGIAIGHFESKTEVSYALLIVSKPDRRRKGLRILVFSRIDDSASYTTRVISRWNIGLFYEGSDQVIATIPPGHFEEASGTRKVETNPDCVSYETMEKGAILYYWKNARYHELVTSE